MRGESMKGKSKKSTYSTTFGVDPIFGFCISRGGRKNIIQKNEPHCLSGSFFIKMVDQ